MYFSLEWLDDDQISNKWCILRCGAYSDLSVSSVVLIRGKLLLEAQCLLEEVRYLDFSIFIDELIL